MAHPRQLIEALMKRLLDAKKANKGKPAPDFYPYGTFVDDPKGVAVRKARQKAREAQPSDPLAKPIDMREGSRPRDPSRLPDSADARPGYRSDGTPSGGYEIDYPHDGFGARYFPEDPLNRQAVREARQRAREVQGPDRLEQPVGDTIVPGEMMESSVREPVRDPSRLPKSPQTDQGGLTGLRGKDRLLGESGDLSPGEAGYGAQVERVGRLKHTGSRQDLDKKLSLLSRVITEQAEKAGAEGVNKDLIRMMEELELGSGKKLMQRLFNQEFNPLDDIPF